MGLNEENCEHVTSHISGERRGWEPRLAGAQHCAEAGIWSLQYGGFCHFVKAYFVIFADLRVFNFEN